MDVAGFHTQPHEARRSAHDSTITKILSEDLGYCVLIGHSNLAVTALITVTLPDLPQFLRKSVE
jgi:hypothetical protein